MEQRQGENKQSAHTACVFQERSGHWVRNHGQRIWPIMHMVTLAGRNKTLHYKKSGKVTEKKAIVASNPDGAFAGVKN
jgi:hypothetical protein